MNAAKRKRLEEVEECIDTIEEFIDTSIEC